MALIDDRGINIASLPTIVDSSLWRRSYPILFIVLLHLRSLGFVVKEFPAASLFQGVYLQVRVVSVVTEKGVISIVAITGLHHFPVLVEVVWVFRIINTPTVIGFNCSPFSLSCGDFLLVSLWLSFLFTMKSLLVVSLLKFLSFNLPLVNR